MVYGATVQLNLVAEAGSIEIAAPTLVYWQDYLRDNNETELDSIPFETLNGCVWPLGIHESYFRGGDVVVPNLSY